MWLGPSDPNKDIKWDMGSHSLLSTMWGNKAASLCKSESSLTRHQIFWQHEQGLLGPQAIRNECSSALWEPPTNILKTKIPGFDKKSLSLWVFPPSSRKHTGLFAIVHWAELQIGLCKDRFESRFLWTWLVFEARLEYSFAYAESWFFFAPNKTSKIMANKISGVVCVCVCSSWRTKKGGKNYKKQSFLSSQIQ